MELLFFNFQKLSANDPQSLSPYLSEFLFNLLLRVLSESSSLLYLALKWLALSANIPLLRLSVPTISVNF